MVGQRHLARREARPAADHARRTRSCGGALGTAAGGRARSRAVPPRPSRRSWRPAPRRRGAAAAGRGSSGRGASCRRPADRSSSRPWPPASAISSARRASTWPRTSARSGTSGSGRRSAIPVRRDRPAGPGPPPPARRSPAAGGATPSTAGSASPPRGSRHRSISMPSTRRASASASAGTMTRRTPRRASAATIGSRPGTGRTSPPSDSSPTSAQRPAARTCSDPSRIAAAMPEVERRAALRQVRRREVDRDPARRVGEAAVADRAAHALARLLERRIGQARRSRSRADPGATSTSTRTTRPSRPWTSRRARSQARSEG